MAIFDIEMIRSVQSRSNLGPVDRAHAEAKSRDKGEEYGRSEVGVGYGSYDNRRTTVGSLFLRMRSMLVGEQV